MKNAFLFLILVLTGILTLAAAGAGLYKQYIQIQTLNNKLEQSEKDNQALATKNQELKQENLKLQKPVTIDGTQAVKPIQLKTNLDLTSQTCPSSDVEIKLDHIYFQPGYRMSWVFAIENKTSVKQDISLYSDRYTKMYLKDDKGNTYSARHIDAINSIDPVGYVKKTVQFDLPKEGTRNFSAEFAGSKNSCLLLSPFPINLPDNLIQNNT